MHEVLPANAIWFLSPRRCGKGHDWGGDFSPRRSWNRQARGRLAALYPRKTPGGELTSARDRDWGAPGDWVASPGSRLEIQIRAGSRLPRQHFLPRPHDRPPRPPVLQDVTVVWAGVRRPPPPGQRRGRPTASRPTGRPWRCPPASSARPPASPPRTAPRSAGRSRACPRRRAGSRPRPRPSAARRGPAP
jgi:hypothetical protein